MMSLTTSPTHFCIQWTVDDLYNTLALTKIVEPRKALADYVIGEKVSAPCRGWKGQFEGEIRFIGSKAECDNWLKAKPESSPVVVGNVSAKRIPLESTFKVPNRTARGAGKRKGGQGTSKSTLNRSESTPNLNNQSGPVTCSQTNTASNSTVTGHTSSRIPTSTVLKPAGGQGTSKSTLNRSESTPNLNNQSGPVTRSQTNTASNSTVTGHTSSRIPTSTVLKPAGKRKRPAWDLKGRLQDMEHALSERDQIRVGLEGQLDNNEQRIQLLEAQNKQLSATVAQKEQLTSVFSEEASQLKRKLRAKEDELASNHRKYQREIDEIKRESKEKQDSITRQYSRELEDLNFRNSSLERQKESLESELKACRDEISGLKSAVSKYTAAQAVLKSELEATQVSLDKSVKDGCVKDEENRQLKEAIANHKQMLEQARQKLRDHETMRRKLHNTVQEFKGNIRVFCRVRPALNEEVLPNKGIIQHMMFPDPDGKVLDLGKLAEMNPNESSAASLRRGTKNLNEYKFTFDKVFPPSSSQAIVFEEISQLVQSALDGYKVCIFACGPPGSGKTYTMEGPSEMTEGSEGMIPRAVMQIFECAKDLEEIGWEYDFTASFLEIYNETIRDLLGDKSDLKHEIMGSGSLDVIVTDLKLVPVKSEKQFHSLLKKAVEKRAVAEMRGNKRSSRSHSVFQLKLSGSNKVTGQSSEGLLSLVDLAGSERLKESGSEGQRLKEAKCINRSLSNLGNVIMALSNKEKFVPYRNSKLTYLLQNSLGGSSKTLMFLNVSPKQECLDETLSSLRFATRVNQCNT